MVHNQPSLDLEAAVLVQFHSYAVGGGNPRRDTLHSEYMGKEFEHNIHCVLHVHLQHTLPHKDLSSNHQNARKDGRRKIDG